MNRKTLLSIGSALIAIGVMSVAGYGCGDDDSTATAKTDAGGGTETSIGTDTGTPDTGTKAPPPPALGAQIDRLGRPAINTALNHTFDPNAATRGAAKDAYNQDSNQATWGTSYTGQQAANLAVFDSLDRDCNNQFLASKDAGAQNSNLAKYGTLASVTADDRLWIDTAGTTCTTYLAVEGNATGLIPNTDCGGRGLGYDVIDVTYSVVSVGSPAGVTDGVTADATKTGGTTFPYLAPPQ
jgi:hypothetical protein